MAFSYVATGPALSNARSNISLINENAVFFIPGGVIAGVSGSILIDAHNNLVIGAGAIVETMGVDATIKGNAGGQFLFTTGAIFMRAARIETPKQLLLEFRPW